MWARTSPVISQLVAFLLLDLSRKNIHCVYILLGIKLRASVCATAARCIFTIRQHHTRIDADPEGVQGVCTLLLSAGDDL